MEVQPDRNTAPPTDPFNEIIPPPTAAQSPPLSKGTRVSVYWTDMEQWFNGTVTSSYPV